MRFYLPMMSVCLVLTACTPNVVSLPPEVPEPRVNVYGTLFISEARAKPLRLLALPGEVAQAGVTLYFGGDVVTTDEKGTYAARVPANRTHDLSATMHGREEPGLYRRHAAAYVVTGDEDRLCNLGVADFLVGSKLQEIHPELFHTKSSSFKEEHMGVLKADALAAAVEQMQKELADVSPLPDVIHLDETRKSFDRLASDQLKTKVYALVGKTYEASGAVEISDTSDTERETPYFTYRLTPQWQAAKLPDQRIVNSWETFDGVNRLAEGRAIASLRIEQTMTDVTLEVIKEAWIKNAGSDPIEVEKTTVAGKEAYYATRTTTDAGVSIVIRKYMVAHFGRVYAFGMFMAEDDPKTEAVVAEFEAIIQSLSWKAKESAE